MAVINDLVALARHDVIVFTDARQTFEHDAICQLAANFSDTKVGCVSGELIFLTDPSVGSTGKGVDLYWRYEKFMRNLESRIHSMLGATGAIYAVRKNLFTPIPSMIVLDDVFVPMRIVGQGYRAIFDGTAKAYDRVADSPKEEYRRKARTLFGNFQLFGMLSSLFNPFKSPVAIQFFSHKLLRVMVPWALSVMRFM